MMLNSIYRAERHAVTAQITVIYVGVTIYLPFIIRKTSDTAQYAQTAACTLFLIYRHPTHGILLSGKVQGFRVQSIR
jgi:hypothetical protein